MMPCPASCHRGGAEQHADDDRRALTVYFLAHASQVASGNVTSLVREHTDHLVWCLRLHEQAGIDEQALPTSHKRIDARIIDQIDFDRPWIKARGLEYRLRVKPH
jgi:hypothetical protein